MKNNWSEVDTPFPQILVDLLAGLNARSELLGFLPGPSTSKILKGFRYHPDVQRTGHSGDGGVAGLPLSRPASLATSAMSFFLARKPRTTRKTRGASSRKAAAPGRRLNGHCEHPVGDSLIVATHRSPARPVQPIGE